MGAVILAAGESSRLGRPKQLLLLDGETLLHRAARQAIEAGCTPVVVVLGAVVAPCREALAGLDVRAVVNDRWPQGVGTSVSAGVSALGATDAALLLVCDQVRVTTQDLQRLTASAFDAGIVASSYAGVLGTPARFSKHYFPRLRELNGEIGARSLFREYAGDIVTIKLDGGTSDIDSEADWAEFQRAIGAAKR